MLHDKSISPIDIDSFVAAALGLFVEEAGGEGFTPVCHCERPAAQARRLTSSDPSVFADLFNGRNVQFAVNTPAQAQC